MYRTVTALPGKTGLCVVDTTTRGLNVDVEVQQVIGAACARFGYVII